jgi:hypothetical protein
MSAEPVFESESALAFESALEPNSESEFAFEKRPALPPHTAPAAAAVALFSAAGELAGENAGVSFLGGTGLGETEETGLDTAGAEAWGVVALGAAETNLLAAAARASGFTVTFGAGVGRFVSLPAFLLFSLHFSRSSTSARALR